MSTSTLSYGPFIGRKQALEQGLNHYYIGPCRKGHTAQKHVDAGCVECGKQGRRKNIVEVEKACAHCGQLFKTARKAMYCSRACATAAWRLRNVEHLKSYHAAREVDHKKEYQARKARRAADPQFDQKRREINKRANKKWEGTNKQRMRDHRRAADAFRYSNDLEYKVKHNLRGRVGAALRAQQAGKEWSLLQIVGCTTEQLIKHLESQFLPFMSWDNWSHDGWHIDHIRPCASFDLTDPEQQKACFFFANLQPLDAVENNRKRDEWTSAMEAEWAQMMRDHGYQGDLFLQFTEAMAA